MWMAAGSSLVDWSGGWSAGAQLGWLVTGMLAGWLDGRVADEAATNNGTVLQSDILSHARSKNASK